MRRLFTIATSLLLSAACLAAAPGHAESPFTTDPAQVPAGNYVLDKDHGKITWSVNHLGFSTYYGQFTDVDAKLTLDPKAPDQSKLDVTIAMSSVGTLNSELDKHLKSDEFFDVAQFPTATFKATKIVVKDERHGAITGDLTLHGVTKPVTLEAVFNQAGANPVDKKYTVGFSGKTVIKRSEFGITAYVPAVGDAVHLELEGEFKRVD